MMSVEIIAEISGSHGGDFNNALRLIDAAQEADVNVVKFQLFDPEKLARKRGGNPHVQAVAGSRPLIELYRETVTPREWFPKLMRHCQLTGIEAFSSVFDPADIPFLLDLGVRRIKIAAFEIIDLDLIGAAAGTGLPIILSVPKWAQITEVLPAAWKALWRPDIYKFDEKGHGILPREHITLLHATPYAKYHKAKRPLNVRLYGHGLNAYLARVGVSDHSGTIGGPLVALAGGAEMIELHLKLPNVETPDSAFALGPAQLKKLVRLVREFEAP